MVVGSVMTETLIRLAETLLDKPGGYLSNDRLPPGVLLDNMPNFEFGALVQVRDLLAQGASPEQVQQALADNAAAFGAGATAAAPTRVDLGFGIREHLWRHDPVVLAAALDHVVTHAPDVEEHGLTVARRVVEDRLVGGHRVVD